jgi:hypothetical protein
MSEISSGERLLLRAFLMKTGAPCSFKTIHGDLLSVIKDFALSFCRLAARFCLNAEHARWADNNMIQIVPSKIVSPS